MCLGAVYRSLQKTLTPPFSFTPVLAWLARRHWASGRSRFFEKLSSQFPCDSAVFFVKPLLCFLPLCPDILLSASRFLSFWRSKRADHETSSGNGGLLRWLLLYVSTSSDLKSQLYLGRLFLFPCLPCIEVLRATNARRAEVSRRSVRAWLLVKVWQVTKVTSKALAAAQS